MAQVQPRFYKAGGVEMEAHVAYAARIQAGR